MIARTTTDKTDDVWTAIAAPLPTGVIQWRQQGKPMTRDGRHAARFVAYIDAQFVRERLDQAVRGEWDLTLELLPPAVTGEGEEVEPFSFKARLQILGVIRESVGSGKDYKTAETDAFKRAAVRFGVAAELYAMEQLWVQMDGDGKFARPVEDPSVAYARRYGRPRAVSSGAEGNGAGVKSATAGTGDTRPATMPEATPETPASQQGASASAPDSTRTTDERSCPKCGGRVWDNRLTKRNPKAPDFKCRDRSCDGVIWPPKGDKVEKAERAPEDEEEIPF